MNLINMYCMSNNIISKAILHQFLACFEHVIRV